MGFEVIVPADQLGALYDPATSKLRLFAKGQVQEFTYNIQFVRDKYWVGGLKFILYGWRGPVGKDKSEYEHEQTFDIPSLGTIIPGGEIVIEHQGGKAGDIVPVRWLGFHEKLESIDPYATATTRSEAAANTVPSPQTSVKFVNITALFKEPFVIDHKIMGDKGCTMRFEDNFLTLNGADYEQNSLEWTFNSLQTGDTTVVVQDSFFGVTSIITTYHVRVIVLDNKS